MSQQNMTIAALQQAYKEGTLTPKHVIKDALERCEQYLDHNIWIELFSLEQLQPYLDALDNSNMADKP
jgi:allophanate hydrolase